MEQSSTVINTRPAQPGLTISAASDRLQQELRNRSIGIDVLLERLWENVWRDSADPSLSRHGVWLAHNPRLEKGEVMVGRFEDEDEDGVSAVVFRPEMNVDTSRLYQFRWMADGTLAPWYHADISTPRPLPTSFQTFRTILEKHSITGLGIGSYPLNVELKSGQAFLWARVAGADRTWRVTVIQTPDPRLIGMRWGVAVRAESQMLLSNGQVLLAASSPLANPAPMDVCRDCHTNGN